MSGYQPRIVVQLIVLLFVVLLAGARSLPAQEEIFSDGFESGDICAWSSDGCIERPVLGTGSCSVFLYMHHEVKTENVQAQSDTWWKSILPRMARGPHEWDMRKEARQNGRTVALTFGGGHFRLDPGNYECIWSITTIIFSRKRQVANSYPFTVNEDCEVTP